MKKLSYLFTLVTLTSVLFSSCSRLDNITVSKRQHRSGYYVDLGSRKNVSPQNKPKAMRKVDVPAVASTSQPEKSHDIITSLKNDVENSNTISSVKENKEVSPVTFAKRAEKKKQTAKEKTNNLYASATDNSDLKNISKSEKIKKHIHENTEAIDAIKAPSSNDDLPLWLMIIFCIILPPLAVGLKFGISTEFWISILLTLLFWIPGVIYALIMILD